ncbi:efflux transporter outer membrane subunit [Sphingomonas nostoxanthinifaciens]|uniref:efflux transporter outer membrane subunit n=1 Tax=Sphingomonas nostoxanthinifaciens TaxID=2872652 RepID=UPI001CC1E4C5|nr:efflux transporter outer membrane subunit [Sphingomonas nostoxanthinifaciens]UAK24757.1 efflux transporter outer membrane subunit [Sphingomonas nostoxanthinifaciens]
MRRLLAAATALSLSACSLAPAYHVPATVVPASYKEAGPWVAASPMDAGPRGAWWTMFADPELSTLEERIERDSPTLAAALARYDQARALARQARADLFPQAGLGAQAERARSPATRPLSNGTASTYDFYSVGGSASYEVDLWGRIRNNIASQRANAQASAEDLANTRLALQSDLADAYFRLRGLDAQAELLRQTVSAYQRAFNLTDTRHSGGIGTGLDVNRARTILAEAQAQVNAVANARAAVEHSIAALVGVTPAAFSIQPIATMGQKDPPGVPLATPSVLLQRRPDIAAAERRVFGANARIGVARAAFFPSLTLGAGGGWETTGAALLSNPATYWALGPAQAALAILDGGRRAAQVRQARAAFDEAAANYRSTVLGAFQEVEDQLAAGRELGAQEQSQDEAATAAGRTQDLALTRYREGASDYLEVVTAQTEALTAQRSAIAVRTQRLQAAVALVRALGGGYGPAPGPAAN